MPAKAGNAVRLAIHYDLSPMHPTGIGNYALLLAGQLLERCEAVEFWSYHGWVPGLRKLLAEERLTPDRVRRLYHLGGAGERLFPLLYSKLSGADLVHCPNGDLLRAPVPVAATLHDITPMLFPHFKPEDDTAASRLRISRMAAGADLIIANSTTTRDDFLERFPGAADRTHVVYMGVDHLLPAPVAPGEPDSEAGRPSGSILAVGTVERRKNYDGLLGGYRILLDRRPDVPPLVIAGAMGFGHGEISSLASRLELEDSVRFTGYVDRDRLRRLYRSAVCAVMVSHYEGFGFPVAEALAHGLPVVASKTGATGEIFHGCSFMVDPSSPESISSGLELALDRGLTEPQREAASRLFEEMTWKACAERTLELFQQAAKA